MADGFVANDNDRINAHMGLFAQFNVHGMDLDQDNVKALFDHLVRVKAQDLCIQRELSALIHPVVRSQQGL